MTGSDGALIKQGNGTVTLGGELMLGALSVTSGTLQVGTGISTNTASFESATIDLGATLEVATGAATLHIRIPNNLTNNGTLVNNGLVIDDLANTGVYDNNSANDADVTSNIGTINNNSSWTGAVLTNNGDIYNKVGATWEGDVVSNSGQITNELGAVWTGDVTSNVGGISNQGHWGGDITTSNVGSIRNDGSGAVWTGDVTTDSSQVVNVNGALWTGKVLGNNNAIFNQTGSFWDGDVVANGGGANDNAQINNYGTWTGAVDGNAGSIFNEAGSWSGDVVANQGSDVFASIDNSALWTGKVVSNNGGIFNEASGTWIGEVVANGGTSFAEIDNYGIWKGAIDSNAGWILNLDGTWTGNIVSNAGYISNNFIDSNTNPTGANHALWVGDVDGNTGRIENATGGFWEGDVASNSNIILNDTDAQWTGSVTSNTGTITNRGIWDGSFTSAGTVNAQNQINGAFTNSGTLALTGSLAGITTLTNTGTLDLRGGGAAQTLTATSVNFGDQSVYGIDIDASGHSDTIVATSATLDGVVVKATAGGYAPTSHYVILSAPDITGEFSGVSTDLAFLDPRLSYVDPEAVTLDLVRNDEGFAQVGETPNQISTAAAAEALGAGNPIYDAILWLNQPQAVEAFDALSGEGYASFGSVSVENSGLLAKAITGHLDQAFAAVDSGDASISGYAEPYTPAASAARPTGLWSSFYGAHADVASDGFASMSSTTGGVAAGLDGLLGTWRLGAVLQAGSTGMAVGGLGTTATSFDYGAGVYAGTQWSDTRLSLGTTVTRHDIKASRNVVFPGVSEALTAAYAAGTTQAFAELSHKFDLGSVSLSPYASLAYVRQGTDAFTETGGAAALSSTADIVDATFATLGLNIKQQFVISDAMLLTASGSFGWRHAFASPPRLTNAFEDGAGFTVEGIPIVADTLMLDAGLDLDVSAATTLDLTYTGQIGNGAQSHALHATWNTRF